MTEPGPESEPEPAVPVPRAMANSHLPTWSFAGNNGEEMKGLQDRHESFRQAPPPSSTPFTKHPIRQASSILLHPPPPPTVHASSSEPLCGTTTLSGCGHSGTKKRFRFLPLLVSYRSSHRSRLSLVRDSVANSAICRDRVTSHPWTALEQQGAAPSMTSCPYNGSGSKPTRDTRLQPQKRPTLANSSHGSPS